MQTKQILKAVAATAAAASTLVLSQCNKASEESTGNDTTKASAENATLVISAIPDTKTTNQADKFQGLVDHLSEELGVKVTFAPSVDYTDSVEKFKSGDFHLVWYGGLTGVRARAAVDGAVAIAQGTEDPHYKSYFIAHESTGLEKSDTFPAEIADLKFTFGSNSSTSGFLMPSFFIKENTGKMPKDFFTQPVGFSGAHDKTALQVAQGQFQAGAINYKTYDKMVANGDIDPKVCRIIWVTPGYADYNFTAHPALNEVFGEGFIDKLQAALISADAKVVGDAINRSGIIEAKNEDFNGIEETARSIGEIR
ncbi:putative selenate ABC transporter substrate-binding protein [Sulfuriroseicoccus oceanibius]|uniref:Putative selenate ABC transporter substrate-binding protein n=1 Tax=Sulfuriroseicoccus oceanibius TaxID=2707525 RepID=A0A6B3L4X5_9BACT|nr:putative selenate ABC transporter substrate-binding protein [Sulfuriroseicoccus oceanibius]QQL43864.1 putative selenate ABC transporter substrate-binding protein [Sulfuriroseicoccus oceanibius]